MGKIQSGIYKNSRRGACIISDLDSEKKYFVKPGTEKNAKHGDRVRFSAIVSKYKKGTFDAKIERVVSSNDVFLAERDAIYKKWDLPTKFSKELLNDAQEAAQKEDTKDNRTDLTALDCFTIDPADAKDYDDAVSLEFKDGNFILGVHIADVSFYVQNNSRMDIEAKQRGFTVYFPWKPLPMLPESISNEQCSLQANVERFAVSCIMEIDKTGSVIDTKIFRSKIKSRKDFSYKEAQEWLDSPSGKDKKLYNQLKSMKKLGSLLKKNRLKKGSLDFSTKEIKIQTNSDGIPESAFIYKTYKTNSIVEEFMLCANREVAKHLFKKQGYLLNRIHDKPSAEDITTLNDFLESQGIKDKVTSDPQSIKQLLAKVKDEPIENAVNKMVLRSMTKAIYSTDKIGHFGLSFQDYCHFTSPIRRYSDILIHRMIFEKTPPSAVLKKQGESISLLEQRSIKAERDSVSLCTALLLSDRVGEVFDAQISGMIEAGLFLTLDEIGVDGMLHARKLGGSAYYYFDSSNMQMKADASGKNTVYSLGDKMRVRLSSVSVALRQIDLEPEDYEES